MKRLALLALFVASGCVGSLTGGPSGDDQPPGDDDDDQPPVTDVSMVVRDTIGPVANATVLFQGPDDALIADVKTDTMGMATTKMPNGGTVTVIRQGAADNDQTMIYTYAGVKGGDKLMVGAGYDTTATPQTITVNVPPTPNNVAQVTTPCGSGTGAPPAIQVTLTGCGPDTDFYVDDLTGGAFLKHAPVATTVELGTETFRQALTTTLSVTNAPAETAISLEKRIETPTPYRVFSTGAIATQTSTDITTPTLPGTEQVIVTALSSAGMAQTIATRQAFAATPSTVDVTANMIVYTSPATIDPATSMVSWTETGTGAPDFLGAVVSVTRAEGGTITRAVLAPYGGPSYKLPALPGTYAGLGLQPLDTPSVQHALVKVTGGYDAVRGKLYAYGVDGSVPMNGTAVTSGQGN